MDGSKVLRKSEYVGVRSGAREDFEGSEILIGKLFLGMSGAEIFGLDIDFTSVWKVRSWGSFEVGVVLISLLCLGDPEFEFRV